MNTRSTGAMDQVPTGEQAPLVMVVGMMRSGTSAITGSLVAMGLAASDDAGPGKGANVLNPNGYFESREFGLFNQRVIEELGGSWYCPPDLEPEWLDSSRGRELIENAKTIASRSLGPNPAVWKDSRISIVLPLWRKALLRPVGCVFVWRDPSEVAMSLWRSNRMDIEYGLAVWAEYNLRALKSMQGMPVFCCKYSAVLAFPSILATGARYLIGDLGGENLKLDLDAGLSSLDTNLHRELGGQLGHRWDELVTSMAPLAEALNSLEGFHKSFALPSGLSTPVQAELLMAEQRIDLRDIARVRQKLFKLPERQDSGVLQEAVHSAFTSQPKEELERRGNPLFSIVTPVWRPMSQDLVRYLSGIHSQTFTDFEVCICDDASRDPAVTNMLAFAGQTPQFKIASHDESGGLGSAAQTALAAASGEFIVFVSQSDTLRPNALAAVAASIGGDSDADVLYTDEDKIDLMGEEFAPDFKPDWSPDLLLSEPYMGRLLIVRRSILDEIGGIGEMFPDDDGYDIMLRATERARSVVHVAQVAYQWSWTSSPDPCYPSRLPWTHHKMKKSLSEAISRRGYQGVRIEAGPFATSFTVRWPIDSGVDVAVIVVSPPARDRNLLVAEWNAQSLSADIGSELNRFTIGDVVLTPSIDSTEVGDNPGDLPWQELHQEINEVVDAVSARFVCVVRGDVSPRPGCLGALLEQGCRPGVGVVGARVVDEHGSTIFSGMDPIDRHVVYDDGLPDEVLPSDIRRAGLIRNTSAVSYACLLTPTSTFREVGGFNPRDTSSADLGYCAKVSKFNGGRIIVTPLAEVIQHGAVNLR